MSNNRYTYVFNAIGKNNVTLGSRYRYEGLSHELIMKTVDQLLNNYEHAVRIELAELIYTSSGTNPEERVLDVFKRTPSGFQSTGRPGVDYEDREVLDSIPPIQIEMGRESFARQLTPEERAYMQNKKRPADELKKDRRNAVATFRKEVAQETEKYSEIKSQQLMKVVLDRSEHYEDALEFLGELRKFSESEEEQKIINMAYDKLDEYITARINELLKKPLQPF